ncbi:hypothetical protein CHS0354_001551 [Potamilus streckersoni]|uniref:Uncharacterized protein n=1 Tax=Potamilus streckersoni TaxID=2493646 RepID=A0AAE0SMN4_9BIVA|nr:hypothetical protein CHS0354_001551 [Potamilus streckersoni]
MQIIRNNNLGKKWPKALAAEEPPTETLIGTYLTFQTTKEIIHRERSNNEESGTTAPKTGHTEARINNNENSTKDTATNPANIMSIKDSKSTPENTPIANTAEDEENNIEDNTIDNINITDNIKNHGNRFCHNGKDTGEYKTYNFKNNKKDQHHLQGFNTSQKSLR